MSALGQKRTCAPQKAMSALPPKAEMSGATTHIRFGPTADMVTQWLFLEENPETISEFVSDR